MKEYRPRQVNLHTLFHHASYSHTPRNPNEVHEEQMSVGAKVADAVANSIGSWRFIIVQACIMAVWVIVNVLFAVFRFDAYPFVFLNLAMSAEAAFSAPVIMMAQNRQAVKDRITAEETFKNTVKEEQETRGIIEHLSAQDAELLKQSTELMKHSETLEKLLRMIAQATNREVA